MVTTLVAVYDSACGGCSSIAAGLPDVFAPRTITRSCRDPHLAAEYPVLAGHLGDRPCRRPYLVIVDADGAAEVVTGFRMMLRAAAFVAPGRRWAALRLAAAVARGRPAR